MSEDEMPTGYVARCRCGSITGAIDATAVTLKEVYEQIGWWVLHNKSVEPRYRDWNATISSCQCNKNKKGEE